MSESILIIEDDATFSATLARALRRRGHVVSIAATPDEALESVLAEHPDWIVLDLNLAGASGLALLPRLRERLPDCRIVVLDGLCQHQHGGRCDQAGRRAVPGQAGGCRHAAARLRPCPGALSRPRSAELSPPAVPMSVDRMEWEHIQRVLREHEGNISATARALNMHRRTLQRKLLKRPAKQ
jgi:two-component system response regulator RegA